MARRVTLRLMRTKNSNQTTSSSVSRREFIARAATCVATMAVLPSLAACGTVDSRDTAPAAAAQDSTQDDGYVTLYDMYAIATYFDGGIGPETGMVTVAMVDANLPVNFVFWHGHGGKNHQFDLTPEHFQSIRDLKKTWVETTTVEGHAHKLFIDPVDPRWRVPGAQPVRIKKSRS